MTDTLNAGRITGGVSPSRRPLLRNVSVFPEIDSTNSELARLPPGERHAHAVLAEKQTGGRGRRERRWHSPAGGNIYLSFGWQFAPGNHHLSALPLVVAVAVARALTARGLEGHGVKWPNDILAGGKKLCGILVELKSDGGRPSAVIGTGINVRMPSSAHEDPARLIDRPWTDLEAHLAADRRPVDRNRLVAGVLEELLAALPRFEQAGFDAFRAAWNAYDLLSGGPVTLETDSGDISGVATGISDDGELLIESSNGESRSFHAGEVRVYRGIRAF